MQAPLHAGGLSGAGAPLDDVDVEMWQLLAGVGDALQAPPAPQLRAGGHFSAGDLRGLKQLWFGESLQDAPVVRQPSSVARAGACSAPRLLQR
jgi:hypothetical protein